MRSFFVIYLIKKHEDFIKFRRKLRLQVYFDNRTDKDSQGSNLSCKDLGEEEGLIVHKGPTPWERQSEIVPNAGENGALEEFLMQVYWDLFNTKNTKWVKDNLTGEERDSLKRICRWNKEYDNSRVVRVKDKGFSFVKDWRSKYLKECSEFIADQSTFSEDDKDLIEDNRDKVTQWASKWHKEGVISVEEEDWVKVNDPKPARLYANVKTHKDNWPYRFILSSKGMATERLARWVECNLKEIATKHKAYIRDTKAFLLHLEHLNQNMAPFPSGTRMISWDIKNFYLNCETSMCLEAIKKALDKYQPKMSILRKACIFEAVQITMTSNNGCIAGQFCMQINGATMGGGLDSASITDIFGGQFIDPVAERGIRTNAGSTGTHGLGKIP